MNSKGRVKDLVQKLNSVNTYGNENIQQPSKMVKETEVHPDLLKVSRIGGLKSNCIKRMAAESKIPNRKIGAICKHEKNLSGTTEQQNLSMKTEVALVKKSDVSGLQSLPCEDHEEDDRVLNSWTKIIGIETLYILLSKKHSALQNAYQELQKQVTMMEGKNIANEAKLNEKNYADNSSLDISTEVQRLQKRESELITEVHDLREQNELLEFRLLELEDFNLNSTKGELHKNIYQEELSERDDKSDSGVISLSPCEEFTNDYENHDFRMDEEKMTLSGSDIIEKLSRMCNYMDNTTDRIALLQAIELVRHYEMRIISLEATITNMCQERLENKQEERIESIRYPSDLLKTKANTPRVIATVSPFTNRQTKECNTGRISPLKTLLHDVDCLQESGIFDEYIEFDYYPDYKCQGTQTNINEPQTATSAELSAELSKLSQIRERLEKQENSVTRLKSFVIDPILQKSNIPDIKHFAFYKEQYEMLQNKLFIYEASEDVRIKQLKLRLQHELELDDELKKLKSRVMQLEIEKKEIEEDKCELEEAENDTRLRCQKLEVKLGALVEKKNDLQFQLQQNMRTIANLKNNLDEIEKKRSEAHQHSYQIELLANEYEERNFELEERLMNFHHKIQLLSTAIPAIVMWKIYTLILTYRPFIKIPTSRCIQLSGYPENKLSKLVPTYNQLKIRNAELNEKIEILNNKLEEQLQLNKLLQVREEELKCKIESLEMIPNNSTLFINQGTNTENTNFKDYDSKYRIEQLEIKEKVYEQTLLQADEMITSMENEYRQKLEELENILNEKQWKLEECEKKIKCITFERERENQLAERLQNTEIELQNLKNLFRLKDEEKQTWLVKEKHFIEEIENLNSITMQHKEHEDIAKKKLETERSLVKQQQKELELKYSEIKEIENNSKIQIRQFQNQIQHLFKEIENHEVTNGELKEEVETLENVVHDLKQCLNRERDEKEKATIELSQELFNKQKEIDTLRRYSQDITAVNTAEEINSAQISNEAFRIPCKYNHCADVCPQGQSINQNEELEIVTAQKNIRHQENTYLRNENKFTKKLSDQENTCSQVDKKINKRSSDQENNYSQIDKKITKRLSDQENLCSQTDNKFTKRLKDRFNIEFSFSSFNSKLKNP